MKNHSNYSIFSNPFCLSNTRKGKPHIVIISLVVPLSSRSSSAAVFLVSERLIHFHDGAGYKHIVSHLQRSETTLKTPFFSAQRFRGWSHVVRSVHVSCYQSSAVWLWSALWLCWKQNYLPTFASQWVLISVLWRRSQNVNTPDSDPNHWEHNERLRCVSGGRGYAQPARKLVSISILVHETSLRPAYWATIDSVQKQRNKQMNLKMKKCERKRSKVTSPMSLTQRRKGRRSLYLLRERTAEQGSLHERQPNQWGQGAGGASTVENGGVFILCYLMRSKKKGK